MNISPHMLNKDKIKQENGTSSKNLFARNFVNNVNDASNLYDNINIKTIEIFTSLN